MKIEFEGRAWAYDDDLITVGQAEQIEAAGPWEWTLAAETGETEARTGRSVFDWRQAVNESRARAFRYLYWVMRQQNGDPVPPEECSFAFPAFVAAFAAGWRAEVEARAAEQDEPGPTQPPGGHKPEPQPARPPRGPSPSRSPGS